MNSNSLALASYKFSYPILTVTKTAKYEAGHINLFITVIETCGILISLRFKFSR